LHPATGPEKLARVRKLVLIALSAAGVAAGALPALGATQDVAVKDDSYAPQAVNITVGDSVTWANEGTHPHNVRFADDGSGQGWTNGPVSNGAWTATHRFDHVGSFAYFCDQHGIAMSGTVNVAAPATTTTATTTTTTTPTTTTPAATTTPTPAPEPVAVPASAEASDLVVRKTLKAGRLRGSLRAGPAGAKLVVRVRYAGKIVGSTTRGVTHAGTHAFSVRLGAAARRRLARAKRLKVAVRADVSIGDSIALQVRTARLR
jgi:plastocyanin